MHKPRLSRQKINFDVFKKLFYEERRPAKEIASYFGIAISSIGSFRNRWKLPGRGRSPFNPKRTMAENHPFRTRNFQPAIPKRKYPIFWICSFCMKSFPNLTGHKRKFCSKPCHFSHQRQAGTKIPGTFKHGSAHWRYEHNRQSLLKRKETGFAVWSYKEKNLLLEKFDHRCQQCHYQFKRLSIKRLIGSGLHYDHIVPVRLGGTHSIENGQILCAACERKKTKQDLKNIIKAFRSKGMLPANPT